MIIKTNAIFYLNLKEYNEMILLMNYYKEIKFNFNQFEIDKMIDIPKILIIGSINKYSIIKDLLYNLRSVQHSIVFAQTTSTNFYNDILPSCNIHNKYSEEIMDNVFNRQSKLLNTLNSTDKRTLVVLDDCVQSNIFLIQITFVRYIAKEDVGVYHQF